MLEEAQGEQRQCGNGKLTEVSAMDWQGFVAMREDVSDEKQSFLAGAVVLGLYVVNSVWELWQGRVGAPR